ncbi:MAG: TIGR03943 family protein [Propionicimonas sp.]|nr:TIGR03943 family protein [Propionicimonas sp.]MEA5118610.1 TIGR03943 family protein [Propionicimonas sp.]
MGHGDGSAVSASHTRASKAGHRNRASVPDHQNRPGLPRPPAGLLLTLIGVVAIGWLAATGQLGLYIHPRYFTFTTVMAGLGLMAALVAWPLLAGREHVHDDHDHGPPPSGLRRVLRIGGLGLAGLALVLGLLVLPPATLTSSTVEQRDLNAGVDDSTVTLVGADPSGFTLRDWAAVLSNSSTALSYAGHQASLTGFVSASPDGDPDIFYLTRFVVTCCTVDAQPVGVPVAVAGWADSYPVDGWLQVEGTFVASSAQDAAAPVVLKPTAVQPVDAPDQPYDY